MSGRGRGTRARGRGRGGRGRGRGKKAAVVVSSDDEKSLDQNMTNTDADVSTSSATLLMDSNEDTALPEVINKESLEGEGVIAVVPQPIVEKQFSVTPAPPVDETRTAALLPQTIDMEADISQLEAPTFTTISRGPPEPMLRLKWGHKVSLIGEKVLNPMIHCCDQCSKPILVYGRMIPCKHIFCLKCARAEPVKSCPRCTDKVLRVEQSGLGTVFMCTHGGSRYGNGGCRRTYLSQRDLQAHINHRHVSQPAQALVATTANELKQDNSTAMDTIKTQSAQRKLSESGIQTPAAVILSQRTPLRASAIGTIQGPNSGGTSTVQNVIHTHSATALTQANLARINTANAQDCHQGKAALHQSLKKASHPSETVADASYYSSVLNSFGSAPEVASSNTGGGTGMTQSQSNQQTTQNSWQPNQYYR